MISDKQDTEQLIKPGAEVLPAKSTSSTSTTIAEQNLDSKDACFAKLFASHYCWSPTKIFAFFMDWFEYYSSKTKTDWMSEHPRVLPEENNFLLFYLESKKYYDPTELETRKGINFLKLRDELRDKVQRIRDRLVHSPSKRISKEVKKEGREPVQDMIDEHPWLIPSIVKSFGMNPILESHFRPYHYNDGTMNLEDFCSGLINACTAHIKEGGLLARLLGQNEGVKYGSLTIEFRELSKSLVEQVLDGYSISEIHIQTFRDRMSLTWYARETSFERRRGHLDYDLSNVSLENLTNISYKLHMVFAQDFQTLEKILKGVSDEPKVKVLVFCGEGKTACKTIMSSKLKEQWNLKKCPLNYSKINFSEHKEVLDHLTLIIHRIDRHELKDVFKNLEELQDFIEALGAEVSNNLLQHGELNLLEWECPKAPKPYIIRNLLHRGTFTAEMLIQTGQNEIFCILGNSVQILEILKIEKAIKLDDSSIPNIISAFKNSYKFIVIEEDYEVFRSKFEIAVECEPFSVNVHILNCVSGNRFKWLHTYGSVLGIQLTYNYKLPETNLSEEFEITFDELRSKNIFVISDVPGMGKTDYLASVAKIKYVFVYLNVNKFVSQIYHRRKTLKVHDIVQAIVKAASNKQSDKIFLQLVFDQKTWFEINVLLDDLDHVNLEHQTLALKAIKILSEMPSVRCWLTCRTTCLDLIATELGCLGFRLSQVSDTCKNEYFDSLVETDGSSNFNQIMLNEYKSKLNELSIARIPLYCNITCRKFLQLASIENHSKNCGDFVGIYEEIINERLCNYLTRSTSINLKSVTKLEQSSGIITNMKIWHLHHAIKFLFRKSLENDSQVPAWLLYTPDDFDKKVLEIGLVETINPTTFCDQSIAEYIVAYFIAREYALGAATITRMILKEALSLEEKSKLEFQFKFPFLCKALNLLLLKNKRTNRTKCMNNTVLNTIKYLESNYRIILRTYAPSSATAFNNGYTELIYFMHYYNEYITQLFQTSLVCCHLRFLKYAFEKLPCFKPDRWCELQKLDEKKRSLLHWLVAGFFQFPLATERKRLFEFIVNEMKKNEEEKKKKVEEKKDKNKECKCMNLLESKDENGQTPLLLLVSRMKHLSECGFNLLEPDQADEQMLDMIKFFLANLKSNINAVDNLENTVLHYVSNFSEVKLLLDYDVQKKLMFSGSVLLSMFIRFKTGDSILLIETLKDVIGNANFEIENGSLLRNLIQKNVSNEIIVKFMEYANIAHVISQDAEGKSALHYAVENSNIELVKILLRKDNVNIHKQDNAGKSVLEYETTEALSRLLKFQAICCELKLSIPELPKNFVNFYQFDLENIGALTIVTGILGSGKSTFMNWLAFELSWSFLVVYINLVDLPESFFVRANLSDSWSITKLFESNFINVADKSKLIKLVENKTVQLAVFVDGVDELRDGLTNRALDWLDNINETIMEMSGKLIISSENVTLLYTLNSNAQVYKMPSPETEDIFKMSANSSAQTFHFSKITPLDVNMLSFIADDTQCTDIFKKQMSRIDILEMVLLEKARNFYHKSQKSSGRRVDESAIERFCETMKLAHLPLSLDVHYKPDQFPLIIDLIKNSYPTINSSHLIDFGIVERNNDTLRFVHRAYSEYIIASYLCGIATASSLSPYLDYCSQVANLFFRFLFTYTDSDIFLRSPKDTSQTDHDHRIFRYEILDSLLANKKYNKVFQSSIKGILAELRNRALRNQIQARMFEMKSGKYSQGIEKFLSDLNE